MIDRQILFILLFHACGVQIMMQENKEKETLWI